MLTVKSLSFQYPKSKTEAVKAVDFAIESGEIFGFLGPSGAGKTTTQKLLIGLLRGYSGSIQILGKERAEWRNDFYEHVGVAFDFPNLYTKLSARENLKLIASYYSGPTASIDDLLDQVGLLKDADQKVEGYSKGMKMRLNFIRALLHKPKLLFLDEPTSGLDPVNAKIVKDMIADLKSEGKTVFITTHNMTVAEQLCDRVAFIHSGAISTIDSPLTLKKLHGSPVVDVTYIEEGIEETAEFPLETLGTNAAFVKLIQSKPIVRIHSGETTLEDIFIKLTGRALQ